MHSRCCTRASKAIAVRDTPRYSEPEAMHNHTVRTDLVDAIVCRLPLLFAAVRRQCGEIPKTL